MQADLFASLCTPNRPDMLIFAMQLTRGNKAASEDIVQESLIRALRGWEAFQAPEQPEAVTRAWLFVIVKNTFINQYRMRKRHDAAIPELVEIYDQATEPNVEEVSGPYSDEVLTALDAVQADHRDIVLRFASGQKYTEIASDLGIPIGTVMSRLYRARKALAELLGSYAADQGIGVGRGQSQTSAAERDIETSERPEPEANSIQRIIVGDDDFEFFWGESDLDAVTSG